MIYGIYSYIYIYVYIFIYLSIYLSISNIPRLCYNYRVIVDRED